MASYTKLFLERFRGAVRMVGIGIAPAASTADESVPTITSGAGVPASTPPNGSLYMRTDGANGDDSLYMRIAGAWVAIKGQTA